MLFLRGSLVEFLVANGADINERDENGRTLLYWAIRWGHEDVVELLVRAGTDVNETTEKGWTPLHYAA